MNIENFEIMRNVDIRTIDRNSLKDIKDVVIDENLSKEERIASFFEQIGNPFCYKCGDLVVKESFLEESNVTLEDRLEHYLATM